MVLLHVCAGGGGSVQLPQTIDSLVRDMSAGGYDNYYDLVTKRSLDLRTEP